MTNTIRSVLCGQDCWCWDTTDGNFIKFNEDGTGELQSLIEFGSFIGAEFDWKASESLDKVIDAGGSPANRHPHLLAQFDIVLTLTKRRSRLFRSGPLEKAQINEARLTDDAFRPKTYTIRLEKGIFITPAFARDNIENHPLTQTFTLRLLFDKSPYPPRPEWKEPERAPDTIKFWEWKEFASRESPELKEQLKRQSALDSCIIM